MGKAAASHRQHPLRAHPRHPLRAHGRRPHRARAVTKAGIARYLFAMALAAELRIGCIIIVGGRVAGARGHRPALCTGIALCFVPRTWPGHVLVLLSPRAEYTFEETVNVCTL